MNTTRSALLPLIIKYRESLASRDIVIDYFVEAAYMTEEEAIARRVIRPGKLFTKSLRLFVVTEEHNGRIISSEEVSGIATKLSFYDRFTLETGMIPNFVGEPVETTLGVFLLNNNTLVKAFGDKIPYVNGKWNVKKIEAKIAEEVIAGNIKPEQVNRYVDYIHFLSGFNDFCVPALSEKAITANDIVTKRRDELLAQYKDQMNDPNVVLMIENELIALDKSLMEGDVSSGFLINGKNFDVQRKRMFLMMGLLESFGDETEGFNASTTNLNDGWKEGEMPILSNDIRRGSYSRAIATAKGGAETKMLGRNFQDSTIVMDDCGTTRGLSVVLTKDRVRFFMYRTIIENDQLILLTPDIINGYIGKTIVVRSPMYCVAKDGYCYTCMDSRFRTIGVKLLNITPIQISSALVTAALRSMHGSKVDVHTINDLSTVTI
jgi:hypothetical protein